MRYIIEKGTRALAIHESMPWLPFSNFMQIRCKRMNVFTESEKLIDPNEISCAHEAPHAKIIGMALAACGYFAFKRDGYIIVSLSDTIELRDGGGKISKPILRKAMIWN